MYPTERTELLKHISVQWYNKKGESPKQLGDYRIDPPNHLHVEHLPPGQILYALRFTDYVSRFTLCQLLMRIVWFSQK